MDWLEPDYYERFACKQGACRHSCCEGWPITVSLEEYYRLLSLSCDAETRRKLDSALHRLEHPTSEEYAQLLPNFFGFCPMHRQDGRCALHADLGEGALPTVCALYPRSQRRSPHPERCCANSCEAVLELLIDRKEPLRFIGDAPDDGRFALIRALQDRRSSLPQRLMSLNGVADLPEAPTPADLAWGMSRAERLLSLVDEASDTLRPYGERLLSALAPMIDPIQLYRQSRAHFDGVLPNWENFFEHALVNHVFFRDANDQASEARALALIYALLRLLGIGCAFAGGGVSDVIDICAAAFRLFDHSGFDHDATLLFRELELDDNLGPLLVL